jgi:hypothetical protein
MCSLVTFLAISIRLPPAHGWARLYTQPMSQLALLALLLCFGGAIVWLIVTIEANHRKEQNAGQLGPLKPIRTTHERDRESTHETRTHRTAPTPTLSTQSTLSTPSTATVAPVGAIVDTGPSTPPTDSTRPAAIRTGMTVATAANSLTMRVAMAVISKRTLQMAALVSLGWILNDWWDFHHLYINWNVDVIAKKSDYSYTFQRLTEPVGQSFPFDLCAQSYIPDLHVGDHVEVVVATTSIPTGCYHLTKNPLGIVYTRKEVTDVERKQAPGMEAGRSRAGT